MQAPKLPSFFKASNIKIFSFKPRYYDQNIEKRRQLLNPEKSPLKFNRNTIKNSTEKGRRYRILVLIIILSLLTYKLLIN